MILKCTNYLELLLRRSKTITMSYQFSLIRQHQNLYEWIYGRWQLSKFVYRKIIGQQCLTSCRSNYLIFRGLDSNLKQTLGMIFEEDYAKNKLIFILIEQKIPPLLYSNTILLSLSYRKAVIKLVIEKL